MGSRRLRPSERRYVRLLAMVTPLSFEDAAAVVGYVGRRARKLIDDAARSGHDPINVAMVAASEPRHG